MKRFLCLVVLGAVVALTACTKKETAKTPAPLQENSPAPAITVNSLNGKPLNLSDLRGKVVVLNFWATWCPPCREEIPSMMKLNSAMAGKPFQMVAVSIDEGGQPAIESFFKTSGFSLPAYTDPDNRAAKAYGITGVPETFVIDKNGILLKKVIGPMAWDSPDILSYLEGLTK
ncbi:TlpA family protein disulfide reductase [Oryzomonas japonica]|uniref:TlpA family protein disulfide reductase n=1 Tax=Oryzomonas japonica TaxID=2603858 RepID=A0A7J4ZU29_9BACT|nr:TlpA disulfide reductase family protein [Oryzomonas japonica]KAB0666846.1 TlpA family protein disulfide reductase [Oryzomonas japonica]